MLRNVANGAQEYIDLIRWRETANAAERLGLSQEKVLRNLNTISERCMQAEEVKDREGNGIGKFQFNAPSAIRANELIGKELGMFGDKVEHETADPLMDLLNRIGKRNSEASPLPSGK